MTKESKALKKIRDKQREALEKVIIILSKRKVAVK